MNEAEYKAMQDRVELLSRLILDTDEAAIDEFVAMGERADTLGPVLDPTAWIRGADALRMVIEHARAIRNARRTIVEVAERAGVSLAGRT